jgi:hypothetical protein
VVRKAADLSLSGSLPPAFVASSSECGQFTNGMRLDACALILLLFVMLSAGAGAPSLPVSSLTLPATISALTPRLASKAGSLSTRSASGQAVLRFPACFIVQGRIAG